MLEAEIQVPKKCANSVPSMGSYVCVIEGCTCRLIGSTSASINCFVPISNGKKEDAEKLDWSLLLEIHPKQLEEVIRVLEHGARKYGRENWKQLSDFRRRYINALQRHLVAFADGQECDKETGLHHMAHAICNCLFLMHGGKDETL